MKKGVTPSGPGSCATHGAAEASPPKASIPNAGILPNITYVSCQQCFGTRETATGACPNCADPDIARVRWMLERLSAPQIDFLRAFGHTLAEQPVTEAEYQEYCRCEYYVEDCDGEYDEEDDYWPIPNTRYWFAGGHYRMGPCGNAAFIRYKPAGLLLRECLMWGAGGALPQIYPPRNAQAGEAGTAETGEDAGSVYEHAVGDSRCAPDTNGDTP